jgi:hypothetical protein
VGEREGELGADFTCLVLPRHINLNVFAIGSSKKDFSSSCGVSRSCSPGTITLVVMASEGKEKKRKGTVVPQPMHLQLY